jgi:hypothetical protein
MRERLEREELDSSDLTVPTGPRIVEAIDDPYAVAGKPESAPLDYLMLRDEARGQAVEMGEQPLVLV